MNGQQPDPNNRPDLTDVYKEMIKSTISLPLEGCKSMATGCATVATLYGGTLLLANGGKLALKLPWEVGVLLVPFGLFALAGFIFSMGYLPSKELPELLASTNPAQEVKLRERHIRTKVRQGSACFWLGLAWALSVVVYFATRDA